MAVLLTQCDITQIIDQLTRPSGSPGESTPVDGTWLLKKTDLSFTLNGEQVHIEDPEDAAEGTGSEFTVVLRLSRGVGKFYVKASGDARYRYCGKVDLSYTADGNTFSILNAGAEPYEIGYTVEGANLTLRKAIVDRSGENSTVSESTTLFERVESFDVSENNVETDCGYFETSEEETATGGGDGAEEQGSCGGDDVKIMPRRGMEHTNGCGPKIGGINFSLPDELSGALHRPCNCHDECYVHGSATYGFSRHDCDRRFKNDMFAACDDHYRSCMRYVRIKLGFKKIKICYMWDPREAWCKGWANAFYTFVDIFGGGSWEDDQIWYPYLSYINCR